MKALKIALVAAAASFAMAGAASAQDMDVSFNVGATSDYVFRGLSQSAYDATGFAGVDVSSGMFYAGAWASDVFFADAEVDVYAGVKPTLGPVSLDLGVLYYGYVEAAYDDAAYWELKAAASVPAGPATIGGVVYYSPELSGNMGDGFYYEANISFPIRTATASLAIGQQTLDDSLWVVDSYTTWNAGVTVPVTEAFSLDVRYIGTDDDAWGAGLAVDEFVGTIKAAF